MTSSLSLRLAQFLCSHSPHQWHAIQSSEMAPLHLTQTSNFTDLSAGLSGELVEFLSSSPS